MNGAEPERKRISRKIVSVIVAAIVITVVVLSYSFISKSEDPVKIGVIIPLSGPYSYLSEIEDNLNLAADRLNKWNQFNDRPIELIVADCGADPDLAVELFYQIEEEHHPLMFITSTSSIYEALQPLAEEAEVVLMGLSVAVPEITEGYDWSFRYYTTTEIDTACIASMLKDIGITDVGLLYIADAYGESFAEDMTELATKCNCTLSYQPLTLADEDFVDEIVNLSSCSAIVAFGPRGYLSEMLIDINESGYGGYVMTGNGASVPSIRTMPEADGIYVAAPLVYKESNVLAFTYMEDFENEYGYSSSHVGVTGYDCLMLVWGLMHDSDITRENLREQLNSGFMFSGVLGSMKVTFGDHDLNFSLYPAVIIGGDLWFL